MDERRPGTWQEQQKPAMMTRRFDFANYAQTRIFLNHLAQLSEQSGYFPDLSFAKTYVNISVTPRQETLGPAEYSFAERVDELAERAAVQTTR